EIEQDENEPVNEVSRVVETVEETTTEEREPSTEDRIKEAEAENVSSEAI
ncbi:unnamed protein product, partial [Adineta steineri]